MSFPALRVDVDGQAKDVDLGSDGQVLAALRAELDGDIDLAHYRCPCCATAVCVVVGEFSARTDPPNKAATIATAVLRGAAMSYTLHGPVIFLGWDTVENDLPLPPTTRALILGAIGGQ